MAIWKALQGLAVTVGLAAIPAGAEEPVSWPDLPQKGFIADRPATVEDARLGHAAFSLDGQSAGVLSIEIPQYAWWTDENGRKHPMIVVQAERAPDGLEIVGLRSFAGDDTVATLPEVELLGKKKPN